MDNINNPGGLTLQNEFWGCRCDRDGAQLWRQGESASLPLCVVDGGQAAWTPEAQGTDAIRLRGEAKAQGLDLLLRLNGSSLSWELSGNGIRQPVTVSFPFLTLTFSGAQPDSTLFVADQAKNAQGKPIFRNADWPLPIVRESADGDTLTLLLKSGTATEFSRVVLQPGASALGGEIIAHIGGWRASFDLLRQRVRQQFDLSEYQRPDLAWYHDQLVQHFTFLYGREILNRDTAQFELDRFLDEAQRDFGGYDGFLIWGVYPRIGVDERTQWDFFDDFPGGRAGLRDMAHRARERGVRFFIPYKPWDNSAEMHGLTMTPDAEQLAQLVADLDADGVFLDTMSAIDTTFRQAIDRRRPGVVFCSEGRAKGKAFEVITGSWDQTLHRGTDQGNWAAEGESMPGVDLWRFIFPEHRLFVINRHAVGNDRIKIIERGFFGGTGWVVWQDIFGLVLSYSPEEAALLKKCRDLFRQHKAALISPTPTPLIPTLNAGLTCNEFPAANKRLWTFYNDTDQTLDGPVLQVQLREGVHFVDIWTDREVSVEGNGRLCLIVAPHSLSAVVEFPSLLAVTPDGQWISLRVPVEGARIQASEAGVERSVAAGEGLALGDMRGDKGRPVVIRLMRGQEVLDQISVKP